MYMIINRFDEIIRKISLPVYYWLIFILYFLYFVAIFGISYFSNMTKYIHYLTSFIQGFIAIVLMARFNPFRRVKMVDSDVTIIFASSFFLLLNAGITGWVLSYTKDNIIQPVIQDTE